MKGDTLNRATAQEKKKLHLQSEAHKGILPRHGTGTGNLTQNLWL
ncbi:MAG: hypothetical protein BMS9Abin25_1017 [Gammaproteobacteria bacterium]|nr:MAG: hypothetical protein BMS9Abin25_1017 [Gammaproteobacteria bacterium]